MGLYYKLVGKETVPTDNVVEAFNQDIKRVALDNIGDVRISTVFLGLNHGYDNEILLFETMVFGGALDEEMDRYRTYEEAEAGHRAMVERVKEIENKND